MNSTTNHLVRLIGVLGGALLLLLVTTGAVPAINNTGKREPFAITTDLSPVGQVWKLAITFGSDGSRSNQTEESLMTFLPSGRLTATFPGSSLPPAIDGAWKITGINTFQYQFRDPIFQNGKMVGYVQTHIDAYLDSAITFKAGGIGVAYDLSGHPLGRSNVTQSSAIAM